MKDHGGCAATLGGVEPPIMAGVRSKSSEAAIPFAPKAIRQADGRQQGSQVTARPSATAEASRKTPPHIQVSPYCCGRDRSLNQPRAESFSSHQTSGTVDPNSASAIARGRTLACRASVAVIFSIGITHSEFSLQKPPGCLARLPGSLAGPMLIPVAR